MLEGRPSKDRLWIPLAALALILIVLSTSSGRDFAQRWLSRLRVQKPQTVNVDLTSFVDPNANPALHQMVSQMVSDKVEITLNEDDKPVPDGAAAEKAAGFRVQLITARKDDPKLVVAGQHAVNMSVDRARLQEIVEAAGHPELVLPGSLDGTSFSVRILRTVHASYGNCPAL